MCESQIIQDETGRQSAPSANLRPTATRQRARDVGFIHSEQIERAPLHARRGGGLISAMLQDHDIINIDSVLVWPERGECLLAFLLDSD